MNATTDTQLSTAAIDAVRVTLETLTATSDKAGASLSKALGGATSSGKSLDQTLQGVLTSLSKMALSALAGPAAPGLASGLATFLNPMAGLSATTSSAVSSLAPVAMFASGGVVAQPSYFSSGGGLGLIGEHGAEAILPLARGPGGELGVAASGGAAAMPVTINITTPDADSFQRSRVQVASAVARAVALGQRGL